MNSICVFCGSNPGNDPHFRIMAEQLGIYLANNNIKLIYGGANVGLMRTTAQAVLDNGGEVTGVITHFLAQKHLVQPGLTELILVDTMHQRKAKIADLACGFVVLPGGTGTLEEMFEMFTMAQLCLHQKPIGILNTNAYYDHLLLFLNHAVNSGMMLPIHRNMLCVSESIEELVGQMQNYQHPVAGKWIEDIIRKS